MDRHLIEGFEACGPRLRQAVAGLSPEELTARPGPGNWSILELVIHLADSDSIAIDRMKRMLIEDNPRCSTPTRPRMCVCWRRTSSRWRTR
jgi:hypothetical protein